MSLDALTSLAKRELEQLRYPAPNWVLPRDGLLDVLVVGGGMCGQTAAFASYVRQHTRLTKGMGHLHQMIFGDSERIRDFGDRRTSLRSCCEEDEEPQTVIGERRQSHDLQASIVQRVEVIAMTVAAVL